jgi:hypothetical protein
MAEFTKIILSIIISSIIFFIITLIVFVTKKDKDKMNEALRTKDPGIINQAL